MKIKTYSITNGSSSSDLIENVNEMIKDGWQPFGNVFRVGEMVYQPMVIYSE